MLTDAQKHAAIIHKIADGWIDCPEKTAILAGAEALEAQGDWRIVKSRYLTYFIPVERWEDWCAWCRNAEPGEPSAIVPEWAVPVRDNVVITGWRR